MALYYVVGKLSWRRVGKFFLIAFVFYAACLLVIVLVKGQHYARRRGFETVITNGTAATLHVYEFTANGTRSPDRLVHSIPLGGTVSYVGFDGSGGRSFRYGFGFSVDMRRASTIELTLGEIRSLSEDSVFRIRIEDELVVKAGARRLDSSVRYVLPQ